MSTKYRKIYEQYYGPIPKEPNGRTYDIHHIDGNHNNNNPQNLVAITVQEHYDIHYAQKDYGACLLIKQQRMELSPEERSDLSSKLALQRVENGTHPFLGGPGNPEQARKNNKKMLADGTHPWYGSTNNNNRIKAGTHNLLGGAITRKQLADGTHSSQVSWCCLECKKHGKGSGNFTQHTRAHFKSKKEALN